MSSMQQVSLSLDWNKSLPGCRRQVAFLSRTLEGTLFLRNVRNRLSSDAETYPRRTELSASPPWKRRDLQRRKWLPTGKETYYYRQQ